MTDTEWDRTCQENIKIQQNMRRMSGSVPKNNKTYKKYKKHVKNIKNM